MMNSAPNWSAFEKDLTAKLKEYTVTRPDLKYRGPNQSILEITKNGEKCTDGFRSDGLLKNENFLLAIEVEAGQTHSDTNVGKYWFIQEQNPFKKIVLFHIYTPKHNLYPHRKELANFYSNRMKDNNIPIEYIPTTIENDKEYHEALDEAWEQISQKITSLFPYKN